MVKSQPRQINSDVELSHHSSYQKLLNRISEFAWLMDIEGQIYLSNRSWQEFTGKTPSSSQPYFFWDLIQPKDKGLLKNAGQISLLKNHVFEYKLRLKNYQGKYTLLTLQIEALNIEQEEELPLLLCTATSTTNIFDRSLIEIEEDLESNIAEYKRKELILFSKAEFVRRILESSQDCIKVLDLQGNLLYMNDGGQDLMEIDNFDRQIRNTPWLNFWHGCARKAAEKAFAVACTGGVGKFDGYCATAKGTPKWWEVVITPMFDEKKNLQEILSVSRDITSRKIAEEKLKERNQELNSFTHVVSHDLKAPLRGISNLSEMIVEDLQSYIPVENKHQLNLLQQRVLRMNALINGLLEYSRVGKQEILLESVNLEELLDEVIDSLDPPKSFKIHYSKPLPTLVTKKLLLNQILANLISNSIKHHHLNNGQIDLIVEDMGQYYQYAIADDGPGIPKQHRDRIFEIFQTLENKTSTTNTGIGLALIKKIVDGEGGKFWLDSETEKGSKFCFTWKKE